jgi:hypothetical protein
VHSGVHRLRAHRGQLIRINMHTINGKGTPNPREPKMVKITIIFHQTGYCRAKKVLNITGLLSEWDQNKH